MLCDDLVTMGADGSGFDISPIIPDLKRAQKFVLGAEFAAVAEALSENFTGLVKAFPSCRLPFPDTWVEVAHNDRPRFIKAGIHAQIFKATPAGRLVADRHPCRPERLDYPLVLVIR